MTRKKKVYVGIILGILLTGSFSVLTQAEESIEQEEWNISKEELYKLYCDLLTQAENSYGEPMLSYIDDSISMLDGVCFAKLIDFNKDGYDELLYVYETNEEEYRIGNYKFEIWYYNGTELTLGISGGLFGTNGGVVSLELIEYNEKTFVVEGFSDEGEQCFYYGYGENGFEIVREADCEWDSMIGDWICSIDGQTVSKEEWDAEQKVWNENSTCYMMNMNPSEEPLQIYEDTKIQLGFDKLDKDGYGQTDSGNNTKMTAEEIYNKLVERYKEGTENNPTGDLTVMEGSFDNENQYTASVRCGVPGNPSASQRLYEIVVDATTGEAVQTNVLLGTDPVYFNINE